jgi:tetratricopeptide (TPR) repeat protein
VVDLAACDEAPWIVDVLQSLVDRSLVRHLRRERFDMLGSVQAYAIEQLVAPGRFPGSGEAARQAAYERHCAWFAALGSKRAVEDACADLANLVVACRWAIADSKWQLAVDALEGAWTALALRGPFSTGIELAEAVCALTGLDAAAAARAHALHGLALDAAGRPSHARSQYETALRLAAERGDRMTQLKALAGLAAVEVNEGRMAEARMRRSEALALARELDDVVAECAALNGLANIDFAQGRLDEARATFEAALARARDAGDLTWQCALLGNLGAVYANVGHMEEAQRCFEQALPLARQLGDKQREGHTLCNMGMLHLVQKRFDKSIAASEEALQVARDLGHARLEGIVQCNLGLAHEERGHSHEALTCFDAALRAVRQLADRRSEGQFLGYLGRTKGRLDMFDEARGCFATGEALLRQVSDTLSLAVLLCDRAECDWRAGATGAARIARDEARAIADAARTGPESELGQALARVDRLLGT